MTGRTLLLLAGSLLLLPGDETPAVSGVLDPQDPLFRALQQLQREVAEIRELLSSNSPALDRDQIALESVQPETSARGSGSEQMQGPPVAARSSGDENPAAGIAAGGSISSAAVNAHFSIPQSVTATPKTRSEHWAFQPITRPPVPDVEDLQWCRDELDRFVLSRLEQEQVLPNGDADRAALLRRVAFDLTGLPPTVRDLHQFVDSGEDLETALERAVDGYLASPQFGERWGRHWLDVVRYADSVGRNWNAPFTYAWRYRDYVIDSLNQDKPFDRFVMEQLAGDLLPAADVASRRAQLTATGFLALGAMDIIEPEGETLMMDRIDEQIDVTTRAFLGLTVACARCHDHKYEPVSMRDYYALAGIFYSTETKSGQRRGNYVADDDLLLLPAADGQMQIVPGVHSMADLTREHRNGGWREVLWTTDPNLAMAAVEGSVQDCPVRLDGEAYKRGPVPARGDFSFAGLAGLKGIPADSSGRLELAQWIVGADNPLTSRVMVNRLWLHLFGRGLVETADNFGQSGTRPSHPELLDHLAARLRDGWSIKGLVRAIVLSRTYRLSSAATEASLKADASNSLYWRMTPRRLEMEAVRDGMLAIAGRLSAERPYGIQLAGNGGKGKWGETRSLLRIDSPYRTVYLPVLRSLLPDMYATFDFPNPTQISGQREVTTVAPQSLFLMNSPFAIEVADAAADRILAEIPEDDAVRIQQLYLRVLSRLPDGDEVQAARQFMNSLHPDGSLRYRWSAFIQALLISGEFRTLL